QDLVHLERRDDGLDQHRRADRAAWEPNRVLRVVEHGVPEPGLEMALELGQIEVGAAALTPELMAVVVEVEPEVEQRGRHRPPVHPYMRLVQVPAAGPKH